MAAGIVSRSQLRVQDVSIAKDLYVMSWVLFVAFLYIPKVLNCALTAWYEKFSKYTAKT